MASGAVGAVARGLGRLFATGGVSGLSEGQLLDRFVTRRDEAAFEALVARHGPMVMGVCRQHLRDPNDVDDAFQATFLVLVRKAGTLRRRDLLGNWLYGVAFRVARRSRSEAARRQATEAPSEAVAALAVAADDAAGLPELHEEVQRLPERYRMPVVLCYLEGLTHEEAAERLRWPIGTVKGRLARARDLLRSRLARRGLAPTSASASALAAPGLGLLGPEARAAVPPALVDTTVKAAALAAAGAPSTSAVGLGLVSARAAALSEGVLQAMSLSELKSAAAALAVATLVTTGAGVYAYQQPGRGGRARAAAPAGAGQPARGSYNLTEPTDDSEGPANIMETIRGHDAEMFGRILSGRKQWDVNAVDRLAHWSRSVKESEEYLSNDPANVAAARQAHRDRMKRLHELTQRLNTPDQPELADTARVWFQQAERDLARPPDAAGANQPRTASEPPVDPEEWRRLADRRLRAAEQARKNLARLPDAAGAAQPRPAPEQPPVQLDQPTSSAPAAATAANPPRGGMGMGVGISGMSGMMPGMATGGMMGTGGMSGMMPGMATGGMMGTGGMGGPGMGVGMMAAGGAPPSRLNRIQSGHMRVGIAGLAREVAAHDKSPASKKILAKLDEPIEMSFANETPLEDLLKYIQAATSTGKNDPGIPIYVDPVGLQEAEKTERSPIQMDLKGVPLKTTLRLLLKQLDLAYCVKDGMLIISSVPGINQELMESQSEYQEEEGKKGGIQ
jgi:RNA polymerase sigma factor (sigma-70 family)